MEEKREREKHAEREREREGKILEEESNTPTNALCRYRNLKSKNIVQNRIEIERNRNQ